MGADVPRSRTWHRSPQRFWTLPIIASIGLIVAAPAGEVVSPAGVGLLVVGAAGGPALGTFRGGARSTTVGVDPDGKIA